MKEPARTIALAALLLIAFGCAMTGWHTVMQKETFCGRMTTLVEKIGLHHSDRLPNQQGQWAYEPINNGTMTRWDAEHYKAIKQHLYNPKEEWEGDFAFFPLFPLTWRVSALDSIGISLFNYLIFTVGVILLLLCFDQRQPWTPFLALCLPCLTPFMVPYSESLFFAFAALGIYGYRRRNYWLYFAGFALAAMTRAAGTLMIAAWIATDIVVAVGNKSSWRTAAATMLRHLLPVAVGIMTVVIIQRLCGAEHWLEYPLAQRHWGKSLSLPSWPLTDWSEEGSSITKPLIFAYFVPCIAYLALLLWRGLRGKENRQYDERETLRIFCLMLFAGNITLALLTQHGCMYSMARLLTSTPFFLYLLIDLSLSQSRRWQRMMVLCLVTAVALTFHQMFGNVSQQGIWLFVLLSLIVVYGQRLPALARIMLIAVTVAFNLFWTTYLFNAYLHGTWIFI